jgi:nitroreductase
MTQFNDQTSLLSFLKSRKSASAKAMSGPGPSSDHVQEILQIATRVPDHGKLAPWRFVVFQDEARLAIGKYFGARWAELHPEHSAESVAFQSGLFARAPVVIVVVSKAAQHVKIPIWEQQLSAGAVCYNIVLAAAALGFDAQWQSDWVAYDSGCKKKMGLAEHEAVAGVMYIGTSSVELEERPRPDLNSLTTFWTA